VSPEAGLLLALGGVVAGFVNTLAGGGSLLTLPLLVWTGLGWDGANATGRVAVLMQSAVAVLGFFRAEQRASRGPVLASTEAWRMAVPAVLGAGLGAWLATRVAPAAFEPIMLSLLGAVGLAMALFPKAVMPARGTTPRALAERPIAYPLLFLVGVYGGFLQAGVGYLLLGVFGAVLQRDLMQGNALKTMLVMAFTVVAIVVFGVGAEVDLGRGVVLGLGTMVGAWFAVRYASKASDLAMRVILLGSLGVVLITALVD